MRSESSKGRVPGHAVQTTAEAGWSGRQNGELLARASAGFDVFVTVDRNLSYQQDLSTIDIVVVVLVSPGNRLADLQPLVPKMLKLLPTVQPGRFVLVSK